MRRIRLFASSRILPGCLGFGPHPLEPVGGSRKSSVDQPPGEGGSGLAALAAPVAPSAGRWQGWGRTFVWALLRARNFTQYLKVSLGVRLEARMIISCLTTPFYSDHLRDTSPECLGVLLYHPLWSRTLCPFFPCLAAMNSVTCVICPVPSSGCCERNAGQGSRGHEGQKQALGVSSWS